MEPNRLQLGSVNLTQQPISCIGCIFCDFLHFSWATFILHKQEYEVSFFCLQVKQNRESRDWKIGKKSSKNSLSMLQLVSHPFRYPGTIACLANGKSTPDICAGTMWPRRNAKKRRKCPKCTKGLLCGFHYCQLPEDNKTSRKQRIPVAHMEVVSHSHSYSHSWWKTNIG